MQLVDDFIWALTSQNLTNENWLGQISVDTDLVNHLAQRLLETPSLFEQTLSQHKAKRLGHYFEQLWHFYWQHEPTTEVLAHSLQVVADGRTLGEADFLLRQNLNSQHEKVLHIELACKFYLQQGSAWLGPNAKDSWQKKSSQMQEKQLKLLQTQQAKQLLTQLDLPYPDQSIALCKGRLFRQSDEQYFWMHAANRHLLAQQPYQILAREQWLAPVNNAEHSQQDLMQLTIERPVCVAAINTQDKYENQRFFIVPNHWPEP